MGFLVHISVEPSTFTITSGRPKRSLRSLFSSTDGCRCSRQQILISEFNGGVEQAVSDVNPSASSNVFEFRHSEVAFFIGELSGLGNLQHYRFGNRQQLGEDGPGFGDEDGLEEFQQGASAPEEPREEVVEHGVLLLGFVEPRRNPIVDFEAGVKERGHEARDAEKDFDVGDTQNERPNVHGDNTENIVGMVAHIKWF
jgi:hypothetical protein